jgi:hypothetical protein
LGKEKVLRIQKENLFPKTVVFGENGRRERCMKKAWYLDEDVLLEGTVERNSFFPEDGGWYCGFSRQDFEPEDVGVTVFFDLAEALARCGDVPVIDSEKRKEYREE